MTKSIAAERPLAGIRVIELARVLAGPWAGQMLSDLGADVIKIEHPDGGDETRGWGPPFITGADGKPLSAAYFHATNRGKRSVAVDFKTDDGQAVIRRLAATADVVIENFKVGGLAKYGLDHASLAAINPKLVTCSITGFGSGAGARMAGYDFLVQAVGGLMSITGRADDLITTGGVKVAPGPVADAVGRLPQVADGAVEGRLTRDRRGEGGFGYDPIFELPSGRTMAEHSPEEKAAISHRGVAFRSILPAVAALG